MLEKDMSKDFYAVMVPFTRTTGRLKGEMKQKGKEEQETITGANALRKRLAQNKDRKVHGTILQMGQDSGKSSVKDLTFTEDSVLYISAHGDTEDIGTMKYYQIKPADLANGLVRDLGDDTKLGHLKIMSCSSGTLNESGDLPDDYRYAKAVSAKLGELGLEEIIVYGYDGLLNDGISGKHTMLSVGGKLRRASEGRLAFQNGEEIT